MSLQEFKCLNCGGPLNFNTDIQKLKCDFCNSEYDIDAKKYHDHNHDHDSGGEKEETKTESGVFEQDKKYYSDEEEENLHLYSCQSCGGEIIGDETMAATSCPFCNNNVVVPSQFQGDLRPDFIIPFKLDKEAAKSALKDFYSGRKLLPSVFKDENHIEEIKGIYVPFWLFTGTARADMAFTGTKVRMYSDGNFRYTETSIFDIQRGGNLGFEYVPVDGSSKIDDIMTESIEPFHWSDAMEFSTLFLPGFLANKYDIESDHVIKNAEDRIKNSTVTAFRNSVSGYSTLNDKGSSYNLGRVKVHYALAPVWFLNTKWKGKFYSFVMNGQTGKIVGDDMPIDNSLRIRKFLTVALILGVITFIIAFLVYPFLGR